MRQLLVRMVVISGFDIAEAEKIEEVSINKEESSRKKES